MSKRFALPLLLVILGIAAALRIWGLSWGLPNINHYYSYHPDETVVLGAAQQIDFFAGRLDPGFYNYGSLYLYLANIAIVLASGFGLISEGGEAVASAVHVAAGMFMAGRVMAVIMGVATVWLVYALARRMYGRRTGVLAALAMAILPIHVMHSHFLAVDVPATFFITACLVFSARIPERHRTRDYVLAGLFAGFAAATKYNAVLVFMAPLMAHLASDKGKFLLRFASGKIIGSLGMLFVGFIVGCPGALGNPEGLLLGIRYETWHVQTAHGIVFANTGPGFVYHLTHTLAAGMGIPMLVLALIGVVGAVRRWTPQDVMLIGFLVPYYVVIGSMEVKFARYTMPILPVLVILAAAIPGKLLERIHEMWGSRRMITASLTGIVLFAVFGYTLLYSLSLDHMMVARDTRDWALSWIRKNIPMGSSIAVPTIPWFYTPPLDPRFGAVAPVDRFNAAQESVDYAVIVDANKEWNGDLLKITTPQYVLVTQFEYQDHLRVQDKAFLTYNEILDREYGLIQRFDRSPSLFGMGFPLPVELPHDMSYTNPTILIYSRGDAAPSDG